MLVGAAGEVAVPKVNAAVAAEVEARERSIEALNVAAVSAFKYDQVAVEEALQPAAEGVRESAVATVMRAVDAAEKARAVAHRKAIEEVRAEGEVAPLLLVRGVWAGGQRHGAVLWSSDIQSNFETLAAMVPQVRESTQLNSTQLSATRLNSAQLRDTRAAMVPQVRRLSTQLNSSQLSL